MQTIHVSISKDQPRASWADYITKTQVLKTMPIEMFSFPMERIDIVDLVRKHGMAIALMVIDLNQTKRVTHVFVKTYEVSVSMFGGFAVDERIDAIVEKMILNSAIIETRNARTAVEVESFPNPSYHGFNTKVNLTEDGSGHFSRPLRASDPDLRKLGSHGRSIVEKVMQISGVVGVSVYQYKLTVEKADPFEWSEIEPSVFEAIAQEFGDLKITRR